MIDKVLKEINDKIDEKIMHQLTDEQCNNFRRTKGDFNNMVNVIYNAGRMSAAQEAYDCVFGTIDESRLRIEDHFDFKAD